MRSRNVSSLSLVQKGEMMQSNDAIRTQPSVLVVDHEAEVRAVARRALEGVGYFVNDLCRFPYSVVALALALLVFAGAVFFHINVFNLPVVDVIGIERSEVGEIMIVFLFIMPAFFVDRVVARQRSQQHLRAAQLRVLRMTMRTVQDIVGNALMSLYLFRAEAEPSVSHESLALFDHIIVDMAERLKKIGDLETVAETRMPAGMGIEYQSSPHDLPQNPIHE
jgi:CheY-like chemotaxis protein